MPGLQTIYSVKQAPLLMSVMLKGTNYAVLK